MRVGFFVYLPFHRPILEPTHDAVAARAQALLSADPEALVAFAPDVLVMAGHARLEFFRRRLPGVLAVNVRHGLVTKGVLKRLPRRRSARWFDYVCVGAETGLKSYERNQVTPREYWHTGYPQLDPLFRRDPPPALPLDPAKPTVLYAPTWNLGLSSAVMVGPQLVDLIRRKAPCVNVIIKPHPVIGDWRPRWMAWWARLAATEPGVVLVRETHADITPYMLAADVLISDASSAIFEFLALDRPIVLVTNPRHRADPAYVPDSNLWAWRDVGIEVRDVERLPEAVAQALTGADMHGERRRHYAQILFGPFTDGENHLRVAEKILGLGAALARGEVAPAALPAGSALARGWHDLRTRLGASRGLRRALFPAVEALRLRIRGVTVRRQSPHGDLRERRDG
jgi:CDP-glycerol glycerophosphotransferase (TagB/SpsB family)